MATQKFGIGAKVNVRYLNRMMTGTVMAFNSYANCYDVYISNLKQEIIYTARELEAWN